MQNIMKVALLGVSFLTIGSLTACSTMHNDGPRHEHWHHKDHGHQGKPPFDKATMKQFNDACKGQPSGQMLQIRINDQMITGQCELHFKPNRPDDRQPPPPPAQP